MLIVTSELLSEKEKTMELIGLLLITYLQIKERELLILLRVVDSSNSLPDSFYQLICKSEDEGYLCLHSEVSGLGRLEPG